MAEKKGKPVIGLNMAQKVSTFLIILACFLQLKLLAIPSALCAQQSRSEVLVIGSPGHAPRAFFLDPGYTPAHIRAALEKYAPTIVGVESNPLWFSHGIFSGVTYEAQYTAVPWAVEHGVPVFGIDWQNVEAIGESYRRGLEVARVWHPDSAGTLAERHETARRLAAWVEPSLNTVEGDPDTVHMKDLFNWYNSVAFAETTREWWESEGKTDPSGAERGHRSFQLLNRRDEHIVEQILTLLRRYPGSRMAVVIGKGHKASLDRKLAVYSDIRVVQLADVAPLTPGDVEAAWLPLDALAGLRESLDGVLYYFNPEGVNRDRVARLISKLRGAGIDTDELRYFEARYYILEKRYDEAERLLEQLAYADDGEFSYRLTVDWELSIPQMARISLGQLYDLRGSRARAMEVYQALLGELERSAPPIPPEDAFKDPGEWATHGHEAFWAIFSNHAAREVLHILLREPYSLSP